MLASMPPRVPELDVDLDVPPDRRWDHLGPWRQQARKLIEFYVRDIGGIESFGPSLRAYAEAYVPPELVEEMRGVARILDVDEQDVVFANLYYDAMKIVLASPTVGCTGFAVDTASGPLHARNLDWTTAEGLLASETLILNFRRAGEAPLYRTVGWPGFVGCLSGLAKGRFAVTLNAAMSEDPPELAPPMCFVLRQTLEKARDFAEAVETLRAVEVASDSLLLVSGPVAGQMAVVERSPKRGVVRGPEGGFVLSTNHYRALPESGTATVAGNALAETSCGRYERAEELLGRSPPCDARGCFEVLGDPGVKMTSTVQQMVLSAGSGEVVVVLPERAG